MATGMEMLVQQLLRMLPKEISERAATAVETAVSEVVKIRNQLDRIVLQNDMILNHLYARSAADAIKSAADDPGTVSADDTAGSGNVASNGVAAK